LRGQEVGFDDMRSAIEQTCGKDLGAFFREWLYEKGLPADFRSRYEGTEKTVAP
jgi:aminopeptidase N